MLILGINMFHSDASAALLVDGQIEFAVAEERINRIKHYGGFPRHAIQACLDYGRVDLKDIDHVAVGRDPSANLNRKLLYGARRPKTLLNLTRMRLKGVSRFGDLKSLLAHEFDIDPASLTFKQHNVEHHVAHIASAYYCSPWESAAGFSFDGSGDWVTTMLAKCEGTRIDVNKKIFVPHSLGSLYTMVSQFIGYDKYGDEGKVMGLAALGDDALHGEMKQMVSGAASGFRLDLSYFKPLGSNAGIEINDDGTVSQPPLYSDKMMKVFGPPRVRHGELTQREMNLAHGLQHIFEEVALDLLNKAHRRTASTKVAMAGGCALNSVVNGMIFERTPFTETWIQPAAGDEGLAVGAALYCYHSVLGQPRQYEMKNAYLGPGYSDVEIENEIRHAGLTCERKEGKDLLESVTSYLADGDVVGWFQGRTEWGPRALGNRSIIAHPGLDGMKDVLNSRIKHREWFRPFAPSVLADRVGEYFEETHPSPFMLHAYGVRSEKRGELGAVTHVDGTGRLQTVTREENPLYYDLIRTFGERTGTSVLLNTSFNENEPIVCSPREAIDCFVRTKMDALAIGPFLITKGIRPNSV